jgi:hypothetical protein
MNTTASVVVPEKGLLARIFGVIFSPRDTYAAVVARPRPLPILAFVLLTIAAVNYVFLRTDIGQRAWIDQALTQQEAYGAQITPAAVAAMERMKPYAAPISVAFILFVVPVVMVAISGILIAVFNAVMGGDGKFKQVFSVVAHSGVIGVLQNLFVMPLNYARESMSSATSVGMLVPFVDANSFLGMFLGAIDLFQVWSLLSLSIGLGVLYKRRTAPIAWSFFALGLVVILILTGIKAVRSGA